MYKYMCIFFSYKLPAQGLAQVMQFLFEDDSFCNNGMSKHNLYWLRSNESLLGKDIRTMDDLLSLSFFSSFFLLHAIKIVWINHFTFHPPTFLFPLSTASWPSVDWHEWLNATEKVIFHFLWRFTAQTCSVSVALGWNCFPCCNSFPFSYAMQTTCVQRNYWTFILAGWGSRWLSRFE